MSRRPKDEVRREIILNMDIDEINNSFDAAEYLIAKRGDPSLSKENIERLKKLISQDSYESIHYALVTGARFEAGELMLADNASIATLYATEVLKDRFPLGEPTIKKNPINRKNYENHFGITL